jgi:hypothetical protein
MFSQIYPLKLTFGAQRQAGTAGGAVRNFMEQMRVLPF